MLAPAVTSWIKLGCCALGIGVAAGLGSALFLTLLALATGLRELHPSLVFALPFAGFVWAALQIRVGKYRTTHQIVERVRNARTHSGAQSIPLSTYWLALLGSVWTHLFGGSAGREGTGVQMGATFAEAVAERRAMVGAERGELLLAGVASGFASIFGTPIAGVLFAFEVSAISLRSNSISARALCIAAIAACTGDWVTRACGVEHTHFPVFAHCAWQMRDLWAAMLFAVLLGLCAHTFLRVRHALTALASRYLPDLRVRMFVGGASVVLLWKIAQTDAYLGLGVPTIVRAFSDNELPRSAFAWKMVFTALTLAAGFLGGEVTPLFFIGACLGNTFAGALHVQLVPFAAVGLLGVFGAGARTPVALAVMGGELFGWGVVPYALPVLAVASRMQGVWGLYRETPPSSYSSQSSH